MLVLVEKDRGERGGDKNLILKNKMEILGQLDIDIRRDRRGGEWGSNNFFKIKIMIAN